MNQVFPVEHGQKPLYGLRCVTRSRLDVLPKNTPGVLDGAKQRILVGAIHRSTLYRDQLKRGRGD
jgi:hypothetical protein